MKTFGRDPAVWLGLAAVAAQFLVAWRFDLTEDQQSWVNATATAVMSLALALTVSRDQIVSAAAGLLAAVMQLGVAFGAHLSQDEIALAGALLTSLLAGYLRTQVTAPIAADGSRVPRETVTTPPP
jgi:hypothetical protein